MADKPKTVNGLMKYMREQKGIKIKGSVQKNDLLNMGYYHGFKGYRYIGKPNRIIAYTDFEQLKAIYDFDLALKNLLYSPVIFIETSMKNRVLDVVVTEANSPNFVNIYKTILIDYKSKTKKDEYTKALQKRLSLRDTIYSMQTKAYSNDNNIVKHFEEKNESLPIWAIFELMTLGEFGFFVTTIKESTRLEISKAFNFRLADDTKGYLTYRSLDTLRNLRNSIAHNNVIFDIRFKKKQVHKQVKKAVANDVGLSNIEFSDITDYLIMIVFLLKKLGVKKTEMKKLVINYRRLINELHSKIPMNYYNQIIHSDVNYKLNQLEKYISRKSIV